jgi:LacI family transcriptional regulator
VLFDFPYFARTVFPRKRLRILLGMTTMAQIAKEAGVSTTTVSHVLNGTRRVNQETVKRVHAAIDRTGYLPSPIARALAGARTRSIGLAISGITNPYFASVMGAIESEVAKGNSTLLLADTHDEAHKELQMVQELVMRRVDGLLLAPSPNAQKFALPFLRSQSIPVVLFDRFLPVDFDQVGTENAEPSAQLVEHLIELGHKRIGFVAGLEGLSTTTERVKGYRDALSRNGLPIDNELIVYGESLHEPARAAVHRLLGIENAPTALVASNNSMTIGVLHALRERGMKVPQDIALVAFDDFEWSDLFQPRLTVIAQPSNLIGEEAVRLLLTRIEDPDRRYQSIRLQPSFIHRESCGCSPTEELHRNLASGSAAI